MSAEQRESRLGDNADAAFEARVRDWERRLEDLLTEVMRERTPRGIAIAGGPPSIPVVEWFSQAVAHIRWARESEASGRPYRLVAGYPHNEE